MCVPPPEEIVAQVYAHFQTWQPHWADALMRGKPRKTGITKRGRAAVGHFLGDGKSKEEWVQKDGVGLMRGIGAIPSEEAVAS